MPRKFRSPEAIAKNDIVHWVYRWWLYGKGTFLDKDGNVVRNLGMARRAAGACADLQMARKALRERKRKGE